MGFFFSFYSFSVYLCHLYFIFFSTPQNLCLSCGFVRPIFAKEKDSLKKSPFHLFFYPQFLCILTACLLGLLWNMAFTLTNCMLSLLLFPFYLPWAIFCISGDKPFYLLLCFVFLNMFVYCIFNDVTYFNPEALYDLTKINTVKAFFSTISSKFETFLCRKDYGLSKP